MTLRPSEPDFQDIDTGGADHRFEDGLRRFHAQRYDRGQYHEPGAQLDRYEGPVLNWQPPTALDPRRFKVVPFEDPPSPARAAMVNAEVAAAKVEGDRYRAISLRYAGLA